MDLATQKIVAHGVIGIGIAAVSAWLCIKEKDGTGWGIVALLFLLFSCKQT